MKKNMTGPQISRLVVFITALLFASCIAVESAKAQKGLIARINERPSPSVAQNQRQPRRTPIHSISVPLLKTKLYTLNGDVEIDSLCIKYTNMGQVSAYLSMVYDVDANYRIDIDVAQLQREILPELERRCSSPTDIRIKTFIKGVRIGKGQSITVGEEYGIDEEPPLGEAPLITFSFVRERGTWRRRIDRARSSIDEYEPTTWSLEGYRRRLKEQKTRLAQNTERQAAERAKEDEARDRAAAQKAVAAAAREAAIEKLAAAAELQRQEREARLARVGSTGSREPSEDEMAQALMARLSKVKSESYLFGNVPIYLTDFRKVDCKKSSEPEGYACNYRVDAYCDIRSQDSLSQLIKAMLDHSGPAQHRFAWSGRQWTIVVPPSPPDTRELPPCFSPLGVRIVSWLTPCDYNK